MLSSLFPNSSPNNEVNDKTRDNNISSNIGHNDINSGNELNKIKQYWRKNNKKILENATISCKERKEKINKNNKKKRKN